MCMLITFTISAIAHEYIVVGIFSVVNFIAFILMMVNVPIMIAQRQLKNYISGNTNNMLFWLLYIILAQPFGIIFSYYQMKEKHQQVSLEFDTSRTISTLSGGYFGN
jgi:diacylglycerol O-acyltransferase-1